MGKCNFLCIFFNGSTEVMEFQMYASSLQHLYDTCYLAYEYYVMVTVM